MQQRSVMIALAVIGAAMAFAGYANSQEKAVRIQGATCETPPTLHCPETECPGLMMINQGPVVEMKTRRPYFLDYPCDLKPGEKVTFVLSLHGGGSYGNWQRHYFPIMDYKDKYRLIIATPNAPTRAWSQADEDYLRNIVDFVYAQMDKNNIEVKAFWLAGHSQGGQTSNRLLYTNFYGKTSMGGSAFPAADSAPSAAKSAPRFQDPDPARCQEQKHRLLRSRRARQRRRGQERSQARIRHWLPMRRFCRSMTFRTFT